MMRTIRNTGLTILLSGALSGPALAATCTMTVVGADILDDASCTLTRGRGLTQVQVEGGGTIDVRRSIMSTRFIADQLSTGRKRQASTSFGQVVTSVDQDHKTCFFNYKAVLCVEE